MTNCISNDIFNRMCKDRKVRTTITKQNHFMFFHFYFAHYVTYQTAKFQHELFALTEDITIKNLFVVSFRGSGKSTIFTMSYPIWAILGIQQKKFVLIICQIHTQAKQHMMNLKSELESNELLKNDLGPFREESDEWGVSSLVFSRYNARITIASTEQSIRGLRHNQHRPDLIICDDIEDIASTRSRENRQKTYNWLKGDVIPAGDRKTQLIIVGNLLHEDSLLMHLKTDVTEEGLDAVFKQYPLIDDKGTILWPGKFPDMKSIEEEKKRLGNNYSWMREYLLKIVRDEDQVIDPNWVQFYDALPTENIRGVLMGVDLAISQKETADYTAIVSAVVAGYDENFHVYILPNPINKRMGFPETLIKIKQIYNSYKEIAEQSLIVVEDIGYQKAVIDQLENDRYVVEGLRVAGDKRSKLMTVSTLVQSGKILFPRNGAESLLQQILGFGKEIHDDLMDAFALIGHRSFDEDAPQPCIVFGYKDGTSKTITLHSLLSKRK